MHWSPFDQQGSIWSVCLLVQLVEYFHKQLGGLVVTWPFVITVTRVQHGYRRIDEPNHLRRYPKRRSQDQSLVIRRLGEVST